MDKQDLKDINVRIYVHNMEIDPLYDFINERTDYMPDYWLNDTDVPFSVSGGYVEICVNYTTYSYIRSLKEHQSPLDI
jgi:hypothetical protein